MTKLETDQSINQSMKESKESINHYFIARQNVDQRAGQLDCRTQELLKQKEIVLKNT